MSLCVYLWFFDLVLTPYKFNVEKSLTVSVPSRGDVLIIVDLSSLRTRTGVTFGGLRFVNNALGAFRHVSNVPVIVSIFFWLTLIHLRCIGAS
jgi:hypothetical protein